MQQPQQPPPQQQQQKQKQPGQEISAMGKEQIVGKELYGAENKRIGKIQDVVQTEQGDVDAVVLDVGGFLGIGAKQIAVPVYEVQTEGDRLVTDLTQKEVEKLPEYQKTEQEEKQQKQQKQQQ